MENFLKYLDDNLMSYDVISDFIVEIDGKTFELYKPAFDGALFDDDFNFVGVPADDARKGNSEGSVETDCDYYAFSFGGVYYMLPKGSENSVKLIRLKYLGQANQEFPIQVFLGVHGQYELTSGSGTYSDWCKKAKFLGIHTLGICEKNTLAGALKFQEECQKNGLKSVIGMECTVLDEKNDYRFTVKVYVRNEIGWRDLLTINKFINCDNPKYIGLDDFRKITDGNENLILFLDPKTTDYDKLKGLKIDAALYQLDPCEYVDNERDKNYLLNLRKFFNDSELIPVAAVDAWYLDEEYSCIRPRLHSIGGTTAYESNNQYFKTNDQYFMELAAMFPDSDAGVEKAYNRFEEAVQLLNDLADAMDFTIDVKKRHLPRYKMTPEESAQFETNEDLFWHLIDLGLERHPELLDEWGEETIAERIDREVGVIKLGEAIDYFLITWDIINWCHRNGIMTGISRGSAGGCLVSFLLGITKLDPMRYNLLFERFLNAGRVKVSLPDIDCDYPGEDRPRVKKYMEERYGWNQVCSVGTYSALQLRAAIKDMSRLYGFEFQEVNEMMKVFDVKDRKPEDLFKIACAHSRVKKFVLDHPDLINEVMLIMPAPKAQSIHACAMMVFPDEYDMFRWVPIRKQGDEYVTEWEGGEMDAAGFLKEDVLGVKQFDKFQDMVRLVKEHEGTDLDIFSVPLDDPEVYRYFQNGWNEDNFHFGSSGLTGYCKQMKPENIEDLIAAISLYRPGAMENGFHNEYIACKEGRSKVEYFVGTEEILKNTYGVFCYQEQIMELCKKLGGLSLVEADDVRKAMVKKKYEALQQYQERFIPYYRDNFNVTQKYSEEVWEAIDKASTYLFNRCISGNERIKRHSHTNGSWHPTIAEMYKVKHNKIWAVANGHAALHDKYKYQGYGYAWSLKEDGTLVKHEIKDIYYQGKRKTYTVITESGKRITVTDNHKFPTKDGEKQVKNLVVGADELFVYSGYLQERKGGNFTDKVGVKPFTENSVVEKFELNSQKGHEGFLSKNVSTNYTKFEYYEKNLKKSECEICGMSGCRLEIHHIDGDHANNELDNLITLCASCHKKAHYEMGRTKMGEKGVITHFEKIIEIIENDEEDVYDVEMYDPYHTFTIENGIVTCNSHAAAYAITGYISQWVKVHYPIEYWSVAFKYAEDKDYPQYIAEINKTGVCTVRPVDINISDTDVIINFKEKALYWSITGVKQVAEKAATQILKERQENGQYYSLQDFISRNRWKGSAVNSRIIQNLILTGAFDALENITSPKERVDLLVQFLGTEKKQIKDDDPILRGADNHVNDSWWWSLLQKKLSGLAFFDYKSIYEKYGRGQFYDLYEYCPLEECLDPDNRPNNGYVIVAGYVSEMEVKKTRKGESFCRLVLESNYEFIEIVVFQTEYAQLENLLQSAKYNLIIINGTLSWDKRREQNIIRVSFETNIVTLTL